MVDKLAPIPTDLLDGDIRKTILSDVKRGHFDALGVATPCETLSPLRESPPGPRPLRSLEYPEGLPHKKLTASEVQQLQDANELINFSADVVAAQTKQIKPFWIENPDHREKLDLWKLPRIMQIVNHGLVDKIRFDQCRVGAEVPKPTILATAGLDFAELKGLRCNHPVREWTKKDGAKYKASHESLVQRWRKTGNDKWERASKALAEYSEELNKIIAKAMLGADGERIERLRRGKSSA